MRKVEPGSTLSNKFWLCCPFFIKLTTCYATNLRHLGSTSSKSTNQRAAFFQPATNCFVLFCFVFFFLARQVDHARCKTRNIDPKLATKECCATSFYISYFHRGSSNKWTKTVYQDCLHCIANVFATLRMSKPNFEFHMKHLTVLVK